MPIRQLAPATPRRLKTTAIATVIIIAVLESTATVSAQQWHMINVNNGVQGDAHLLIDNNINTLIDAGNAPQGAAYLVPYLAAMQVAVIHHLFVSHPHTDHYGGIDKLLDAGVIIENIYYNLPPNGIEDSNYKRAEFLAVMQKAAAGGTQTSDINKGFILQLPASKIEVLHAEKTAQFANNINDYSLVMRWSTGGIKTLFTGDLGKSLGNILANDQRFKADILKVPRHGVTSVAPNRFFDNVNPALNMFPSTRALWSHSRAKMVKTWTINRGIKYCNNGLNGNVVLTISDPSIIIQSQQPSEACPDGVINLNAINQQSFRFANLAAILDILLTPIRREASPR